MRKLGKMGLGRGWSFSGWWPWPWPFFRLSVRRSSSLAVNKWLWAGLAEDGVLGRRHRRNRYICSTLYSGCFHVREMLIREWCCAVLCSAVLIVCTYTFVALSGWRPECLLSISQYGYGIAILYEVHLPNFSIVQPSPAQPTQIFGAEYPAVPYSSHLRIVSFLLLLFNDDDDTEHLIISRRHGMSLLTKS
jgi:hypothetical protein